MDEGTRQALLASVDGDITRMEAELAELQRIRAYLLRSQAVQPPPVSDTDSLPLESQPATVPAQANGTAPKQAWREVVGRVLRDAGRNKPLRAVTIADLLVSHYGVAPREGRNLERKVYTIMSRRPDIFVNTGGGLWTLAEFRPDLAKNPAEGDDEDEDDSDTE